MKKNVGTRCQTSTKSDKMTEFSEENKQIKNCSRFENNVQCLTQTQSISVIKELSKKVEPQMKKKGHLPEHILFDKNLPVPYKCTVCGKTFKSKSNCCYHKHCAASSEKPFSCSTCNRKFSTKTHYNYHNLIHTGLNPHKCTKCGKSFKTKHKLTRHSEIHSEKVSNFSCDICSRRFLRESSVKVHRRTHTNEKLYTCSECSKVFREKKNLIFHLNSHKGIKDWICEVCGKAYTIKWNLELHKRIHTRIRPFQCPIPKCQQTFSQNRYLKRHMETHRNSIKFVCSICEKVFSRKDNLQRHVVNTHLEYQTQNAFVNQKVNNIHSNAITPVSSNPTVNQKEKDSVVSAVRTVSVIKSVTKTHDIVDFNSVPANNYISVIKRTDCDNNPVETPFQNSGNTELSDVTHFNLQTESNQTLQPPSSCFQEQYKESWKQKECDDVHCTNPQNLLNKNLTLSAESFSGIKSVNTANSDIIFCEPRTNVISHTSSISVNSEKLRNISTEQNSDIIPIKSRCMLPKKVITASYKECSYALFENQEIQRHSCNLDNHLSDENKYSTSYNLLDLSHRVHE